jgi:APA family basic amino acid/polyamine antiporter
MLGVVLSQLLGLSRTALAMARRGDLPYALNHLHPHHKVPDRAVLVVGFAAAVVAATGGLQMVASTASFAILIYYGIANAAALRMPAHAKLYSDAVPLVGLVGCSLLALSLTSRVITVGLALLLAGFVMRWILHRIQPPTRSR